MAVHANVPSPPPPVAAVFDRCPGPARTRLKELRTLIFEAAAAHPEIGALTETLKWGEPSYAPKRPRTGTPVRLGWDTAGETVSLLVHCQTRVAEAWRAQYADTFDIIGDRELRLSATAPLPDAPLRHCIAMALTYHARKLSQ